MSRKELERFAAAALDDPALVQGYLEVGSLAELAARLRADGYEVSDEEVEAAYRRSTELSDDQLDAVSGGGAIAIVGGMALTFGVIMGGVVAIEAIDSHAKGKPSVFGEKLKDFASRLYPQ